MNVTKLRPPVADKMFWHAHARTSFKLGALKMFQRIEIMAENDDYLNNYKALRT